VLLVHFVSFCYSSNNSRIKEHEEKSGKQFLIAVLLKGISLMADNSSS